MNSSFSFGTTKPKVSFLNQYKIPLIIFAVLVVIIIIRWVYVTNKVYPMYYVSTVSSNPPATSTKSRIVSRTSTKSKVTTKTSSSVIVKKVIDQVVKTTQQFDQQAENLSKQTQKAAQQLNN